MDASETPTHSFVIKIWLEEPVAEAHQALWRGHITHVPSGYRQYLKELAGIVSFVAPYLIEMGVQLDALQEQRRADDGAARVQAPLCPPDTSRGDRDE